MRDRFANAFAKAFHNPPEIDGNFVRLLDTATQSNQQQTNEVFTDKWDRYEQSEEKERLYDFQRQWYLKLYGFADEAALAAHLRRCRVVFDAGCGLGYNAARFARLAPGALVIGMDYSDAALPPAFAATAT
jgi:SAM-dependent methyltransferase